MFKRYPYTIALLTVISFVVCIVWLFTHEACMHPLGNGLAAWWAFIVVPICSNTSYSSARCAKRRPSRERLCTSCSGSSFSACSC